MVDEDGCPYVEPDDDGLDGPRFFKLAWRLPAYEGVIAARFAAEEKEGRRSSTAGRDGGEDVRRVGSSAGELKATFGNMIEFQKVEG